MEENIPRDSAQTHAVTPLSENKNESMEYLLLQTAKASDFQNPRPTEEEEAETTSFETQVGVQINSCDSFNKLVNQRSNTGGPELSAVAEENSEGGVVLEVAPAIEGLWEIIPGSNDITLLRDFVRWASEDATVNYRTLEEKLDEYCLEKLYLF